MRRPLLTPRLAPGLIHSGRFGKMNLGRRRAVTGTRGLLRHVRTYHQASAGIAKDDEAEGSLRICCMLVCCQHNGETSGRRSSGGFMQQIRAQCTCQRARVSSRSHADCNLTWLLRAQAELCLFCRSFDRLMFLVEQAHWFYEVIIESSPRYNMASSSPCSNFRYIRDVEPS